MIKVIKSIFIFLSSQILFILKLNYFLLKLTFYIYLLIITNRIPFKTKLFSIKINFLCLFINHYKWNALLKQKYIFFELTFLFI